MSHVDHTHDPALRSWVPGADGHADFPIQNLPLGIASLPGTGPRAVTAIGDQVLDLTGIAGALPPAVAATLTGTTLNAVLALPSAERMGLRRRLSALLADPARRAEVAPFLHPVDACTLHLPAAIGDYTDFYVGIHHATNVGRQFRPDTPLLPNYKHVPIGYHGRASSIRVSGTRVTRPNGQTKPPQEEAPRFGPSRRLDYELELGIWIGEGNRLGHSIPIDEAERHVAGFCLLNDWSARDIQAWEYQPLGPFLAKNFATTISPWIVSAEALAPFRIAPPPRPAGDPAPLPYLTGAQDGARGGLSLELGVTLSSARMRTEGLPPHRLSRGSAAAMYWTVAQIVTHHASNGCNLQPGDLIGTGTLSGEERGAYGSLLEISEGGKQPLTLPTGETRTFVEDGDEIAFTATAHAAGFVPIGFGPCRAIVEPAP